MTRDEAIAELAYMAVSEIGEGHYRPGRERDEMVRKFREAMAALGVTASELGGLLDVLDQP